MSQFSEGSGDSNLFFDSKWIENRYSIDCKARNLAVVTKFVDSFLDWEEITIIDLGAGFGSNLKYLYDKIIPKKQHWILLDHDNQIINPALDHITQFFEKMDFKITRKDGKIHFEKRELNLILEYHYFDFRDRESLKSLNTYKPDVFTANAFFDLFSKEHIKNFLNSSSYFMVYSSLNYLKTKLNQNFANWERWIKHYDEHMKIKKNNSSALGNEFPTFIRKFAFEIVSGKSVWKLNTLNKIDLALINSLFKFMENSVPSMLKQTEVEEFQEWIIKSKEMLKTQQLISIIHEDLLFVNQM